jgi:hypothetical protein
VNHLEVSNGCGKKVSDATAECEAGLAFVEYVARRNDAICKRSNPERKKRHKR